MIRRQYRDIDPKNRHVYLLSSRQGRWTDLLRAGKDDNETPFAHVPIRLGESDMTMENSVQAIYVAQSWRVQR
jgi:hypothetical protein